MDTITPPLEKAISIAGSEAKLAKLCGCAQQTINKLRHGKLSLDADWAIKIARAVNGAVPAEQLCASLASWKASTPDTLAPTPNGVETPC